MSSRGQLLKHLVQVAVGDWRPEEMGWIRPWSGRRCQSRENNMLLFVICVLVGPEPSCGPGPHWAGCCTNTQQTDRPRPNPLAIQSPLESPGSLSADSSEPCLTPHVTLKHLASWLGPRGPRPLPSVLCIAGSADSAKRNEVSGSCWGQQLSGSEG